MKKSAIGLKEYATTYTGVPYPPGRDLKTLIAAKWRSLMQHVANKHDNHGSPLFQKCAHDDEIENRRWIRIGIKLLIFTLSAVFQIILQSINVVD